MPSFWTRKVVGIAMFLSLLVTVGTQWNLTRAILFQGYLSHPFIVVENDDEPFYLHLIQSFATGQEQSSSLTYPFLGVRIEAGIERITGLDVKIVSILFDYVAVFLLGLTTLWASWIFFSRRWIGMAAGAGYLLWPSIFHVLSRPVSPQINAIFLFFSFGCFFRRSSRIPWLILHGLSLGLLFSVYPYYWTFALTWVALEEMWMMYRRTWSMRRLWMYGAVVVASLPFFVHLLRVRVFPYYAESMDRAGLLHDRWPAGLSILTLLLVFTTLLLLLMRKVSLENQDDRWRIQLLGTGLVTSALMLTQQAITGVQLEASAHYLPIILYVLSLIVVMGGERILKCTSLQRRYVLRVACVAGLGLLLVYSTVTHSNAFSLLTDNAMYPSNESEQEVYTWFRQQKIEAKSIAIPYEMSQRLMIYTKNRPIFSPLNRLLLKPTQELVDRFQYADVTNPRLTEDFSSYVFDMFGLMYQAPHDRKKQILLWTNRLPGAPTIIPSIESFFDDKVDQARRQRSNLSLEGFQAYLSRFKADYVVYRRRDEASPYDQSLVGQVVYSNKDYMIRRLEN